VLEERDGIGVDVARDRDRVEIGIEVNVVGEAVVLAVAVGNEADTECGAEDGPILVVGVIDDVWSIGEVGLEKDRQIGGVELCGYAGPQGGGPDIGLGWQRVRYVECGHDVVSWFVLGWWLRARPVSGVDRPQG